MKIPFLSLEPAHSLIKSEMMEVFESVYNSYNYILGSRLSKFEEEYALFNNTKYAIGVSNGLDALHLSLRALDIKAGDEVIIPSNTFIATALAVSYTGAVPVFAEPDPITYNISPRNIEDLITSRTKAVIPVHLYGQACEMDDIMSISNKHGLFVVEDNAQAHGASWNNKLTGSWGHVNATSFYPGKNLGALGDGGAVTTDDSNIANRIQGLRNYGSHIKYHHDEIGFNMRLDELQAAFLSVKIKYLQQWTVQRQKIAAWYNEALQGIGDIKIPQIVNGASHVYHLYVIRTSERDALQQYLSKNEIGTLIHYPIPPYLQKAYSSLDSNKLSFPIADRLGAESLSLPIWPGMEPVQIKRIASLINQFFADKKL